MAGEGPSDLVVESVEERTPSLGNSWTRVGCWQGCDVAIAAFSGHTSVHAAISSIQPLTRDGDRRNCQPKATNTCNVQEHLRHHALGASGCVKFSIAVLTTAAVR